jgi:chromosome segregation protein
MFLKSITIKGFKSFADPVSLRFEPGVTVIVGPNGSGKSNIVDAISWVLGAQAPSTLRSNRMEDVIFAGTEERPPLGRAEVELTIDNSARELGVDFAEVRISRKLFRSGEAEYGINGEPCRLMDIEELLSRAGMGRQRHFIIGQGQLEAVLSSQAEERRRIVEEAAQLGTHRQRRTRAERRLETSQDHLERLEDIARELKRQMRPLRRQAEAAEQREQLVSQRDELRRRALLEELRQLDVVRTGSQANLASLRTAQGELVSLLQGLEQREKSAMELVEKFARDEAGPVVSGLERLAERTRGTLAVVRERKQALEREAKVVEERGSLKASLRVSLQAMEQGVLQFEQREALLVPQLEQAISKREHLESRLAQAEQVAARAKEQAQEMEKQAMAAQGQREAESRERDGLQKMATQAAERINRVVSEHDKAAALLEATKGSLLDSEAESRESQQLAETLEEELAVKKEHLAAVREKVEALESTRHQVQARRQAISELVAVSGATLLMAQGALELEGVIGILSDLIEVEPGWEAAVRACVGSALASVLVRDEKAARRAFGWLQQRAVPGSLIPLTVPTIQRDAEDQADTLGSSELASKIRIRTELLSPEDSKALGRFLRGLLQDVVVLEDDPGLLDEVLEERKSGERGTLVTKVGDRIGPDGWRVRAAISEVTPGALEELTREAARAEREAVSQREALKILEPEVRALERELSRALRRRDAAASVSEQHQHRLVELEERLARLEEELVLARQAQASIDQELRLAEARVAQFQEDSAALQSRAHASTQKASELAQMAKEVQEGLGQARLEVARLELELTKVREAKAGLQGRLGAQRERLASLLADASEDEEAVKARQYTRIVLARLETALGEVGERIEAKLRQARELQRKGQERFGAANASLAAVREEKARAQQEMEKVVEWIHKEEVGLAETEVRLSSLAQWVERELGCPLEELRRGLSKEAELNGELGSTGETFKEGSTDCLRALAELDAKIEAIGPVNPLAAQELHDLEARYEAHRKEMDDARAASRELRRLMAEIDNEILSRFTAVFTDVSRHFSLLIASLFPGGAGRLVLTDPDRLLDSGIEIEIRPPGKGMRRVSSLSGGERAMVALAFLFAVFRSAPSPFYLLDEVEAALDDVNLHRFINLLDEFRNEAQMIVISHQKRTMEAADVIYGVSAAPGSSSKVLSERLREPA